MHQTRAQVSKNIPIPRKGTKYVARPLMNLRDSVPVVIAIRDMLNLAKTAKEVRHMVNQKLLKINNKVVKDYRDSIRLFNLLEADKTYVLSLTPQGKFAFEETKHKERPCKVIGKKILNNKKVQLNLHDGTNILSDDKKIKTQDTVYLDLENKVKKHLEFSHGKDCIVIKGKLIGLKGKVEQVEGNKAIVKIKSLEENVKLEKSGVIII
jgi:small subunit ribosomal protein S4e